MNLAHFYSDKPAFQTLEDIKNKNVLVMGLGLNGGGEATVRFLLKHGANVTITDMKTKEQLASTISSKLSLVIFTVIQTPPIICSIFHISLVHYLKYLVY